MAEILRDGLRSTQKNTQILVDLQAGVLCKRHFIFLRSEVVNNFFEVTAV